MAAAGLDGVEYVTCGEAHPAWLMSSIPRLPPGLDARMANEPEQRRSSGKASIYNCENAYNRDGLV
jgi:hypothetical protein